MTGLTVLRPEHRAQWLEVLEHSFQSDFYHLPQYHALAEERGEGKAHLFVYESAGYVIAVPLLLRQIGEMPCHERLGRGWQDATSVYGYVGPIASHADLPAPVLHDFQACLHEELTARKVVTVFSRLHPLIPQRAWLADLGVYTPMGPTVSMDLTQPLDVQRSHYRGNHKRDINRLQRLGVNWCDDKDWVHLDDFVGIYYENMRRVNASGMYFFDRAYFHELMSISDSEVHLFVCVLDAEVICGGLFLTHDSIVQYHLGGTRQEFLQLAPMKTLFDGARLWANERQARVLHLGGGVGAREDSLFHFKAGFSTRRHEFAVWRWVILPELDAQLREEKLQWAKQRGLVLDSPDFFPSYRCPECPCIHGD